MMSTIGTEELIEKINKDGYVVLPNLITEKQCDRYKDILNKSYKKFNPYYASNSNQASHGLDNKRYEKTVYNVHNKDLSFYQLFEHADVLEILDLMLLEGSYGGKEPYYLYNNSARCPLAGGPVQQLHSDSRLPGINYCIVANVIWAFDDFTEKNGATRIVPGSHRTRAFAEEGKVYEEEILVTLKKGSALVFDANLWHGGGANEDGSSRWALTLGYARWFIKPAFDYMKNTPHEIYDALSDKQRKLMGFNSVPPADEFTRVRSRSELPERPDAYKLESKV